jgi:hypothetical protein
MFLIVVSMMALNDPSLIADAAPINRLIEQLGSEVYAEREAATKALDRLGEPSLEHLHRASEKTDDVEIRRRTEGLLKTIEPRVVVERALAIRKSQLSPEEKGRMLRPLIQVGMTGEEVSRILGWPIPAILSAGTSVFRYPECDLSVSYDEHNKVDSIN